MKRFYFTCLIFIPISIIAQIATPTKHVSPEHIEKHISYLASDELMGRATGSEGINLAANYVEKFFAENKIKPFYKTYRDSFEIKKKFGYNLLGFVEGTDHTLKEEYIIIGAHYA